MQNIQLMLKIIDSRELLITDSGPWYHEFNPEAWIKEPWNAYSSLFFLVPVFFWLWKLRGQYKEYPMISLLLPLLLMNGIGSTVYHAFRNSEFALLLDWMPAFLMNLMLAWYMWYKVLNKCFVSVLMILGFYFLAGLSVYLIAPYLDHASANIGYFFIGLSIIIPAIIFLIKTNYYKGNLLVFTYVFLGIALLFRSLDYPTTNPFPELLPQGTHFLWHITSAFAVFTMGFYFMYIKDVKIEIKSSKKK